MSIVAISDGSSSKIGLEELLNLAAQLNFHNLESKDAEDYLKILRSFEAVLDSIKQAPDYEPPSLRPQETIADRNYWKADSNPFNAWSHQCHLKSAAPTSQLLAGRTIVIKDNISVGSLPTTMGLPANAFAGNESYTVSPIDAVVVERILAAGAIIKGTSTCESYCASPLSFTAATGLVHNPRLHGYTAGGSSSGSAVLVAAHQLSLEGNGQWGDTVELAIGSDQAGSVRVPASFNGLYGLKPTFGLVPYTGAGSMCSMIDHLGPIAVTLEDIAALLQVMAGYDGLDPRMTPQSPLTEAVKPYTTLLAHRRAANLSEVNPARGLKIGLLKEAFAMPDIDNEVKETIIRQTTEYMSSIGASVLEVSVPMHAEGPAIWTAATRPSMSSTLCQGQPLGQLVYQPPHCELKWPSSQETYDSLTKLNPAVINIMLSELFARKHANSGIAAKAHRKALELREAYDLALEQVDVLVAPCTPGVAMPHPESHAGHSKDAPGIMDRLKSAIGLTSNTCPFNVTGHPALNVPCGFLPALTAPEIKLPFGMQIIGRRWADDQVLEVAALFELGRDRSNA
ncbi:hypothetical protein V2A60_005905 [Cordyceps javanica]